MRICIPLLVAMVLVITILIVPSVDAEGTSMTRMDDRTFIFDSDVPGLWDFGDGTSTYSKGGSLSHTFPSGRSAVSFTSSDGTVRYVVNVFDDSPPLTGSAGAEYRCRLTDSVGVTAYDTDGEVASWLRWDADRSCAIGIPPKEGSYLVVMTLSDGFTWSYHLEISGPVPSPPVLSVDLTSDGLRVRGEPSISLSGRFVEWSVFDMSGTKVAISNQSVLDIEFSSPGTYCVIVETVYGEPSLSASGLITVTGNNDRDNGDMMLLGIIVAIGVSAFIFWRFI